MLVQLKGEFENDRHMMGNGNDDGDENIIVIVVIIIMQ